MLPRARQKRMAEARAPFPPGRSVAVVDAARREALGNCDSFLVHVPARHRRVGLNLTTEPISSDAGKTQGL